MSTLSLAGMKATRWLANRLSIEAASDAGSWIGRNLGSGSKRDRRALRNMARALPATSEAERRIIALSMWDNFGRTVAESFIIDRIAREPGRVTLVNPELLDDGAGSGRGTVFVGLHFGNWEATVIPALRHGHTPIGVYKPLADPRVDAFVLSSRKRLYPGGLLPATRASILKITRHVRAGGSVCVLADHRDPTGLPVPFFGHPAPSAQLPALLAARYGARIVAARVDRLPGARFKVTLEHIPLPLSGDLDQDVLEATAAIQAKLQTWIEKDPGRWVWFYKRWADD